MIVRITRIACLIAIALFLLTFPLFASQFLVVQIGIQSLFLGIVALSLIFLAGYGGMVSLAQMALYGASGYMLAVLTVTYSLPWFIGVIAGLIFATLLAAIGLVLIAGGGRLLTLGGSLYYLVAGVAWQVSGALLSRGRRLGTPAFRAYDSSTGEQLWQVRLPAGGNATPMTYTSPAGRQFVVLAAGGSSIFQTKRGDYVIAYALPD